MTAVERVRRAQRVLGAAAVTQSLAWGIATALVIFAATSYIGLASPEFAQSKSADPAISAMPGLIVTALVLWRARPLMRADRVALWIEERIPALHYSLITAM